MSTQPPGFRPMGTPESFHPRALFHNVIALPLQEGVRGAMEQRTDLRVFDKTFVLSNTLSAGTGALKASDFRPKNWFDESKFTTLFTP